MPDPDLTPEQNEAVDKAVTWLDNYEYQRQQVMRMIGPAGSGKTTILKKIAARTKRRMRFGAFAGKAAMVLRTKGCTDAETLHKMIYQPRGASVKNYREALAELETITDVGKRAEIESKLTLMRANMEAPGFIKRLPQEFHRSTAFGVDEVSMVDDFVGNDLSSYAFPILAVGDPFQLPPVMGSSFFFPKGYRADIELTQIHRQAAGSPVLRLATAVRQKRTLPYGKMGDSQIVRQLPLAEYAAHDQILCGTNKMRMQVNTTMRKLQGRRKVLEPGEKIICLQNNYEVGVMNGSQWEVVTCEGWMSPKGFQFYKAHVKSLDEPGLHIKHALIHLNPLLEGHPKQDKHWTPMLTGTDIGLVMTYGYCVTVHKAQGSQWNSVALIDDWGGTSYLEWLYTGITRAAERVTIIRSRER